jgi:hypothetical protein
VAEPTNPEIKISLDEIEKYEEESESESSDK